MGFTPFERRRRAVARLALYSSLGLTALFVAAGLSLLQRPFPGGGDTRWLHLEWLDLPEVRLFQQYLRVDSSPETGSELAAALLLATPLEAAGLEVIIERVGDHNVNLWAILEGQEPGALVLLSHLDVEPASSEGWRYPPFAGVVSLPWIFGRGAFDMKSVAVAQLMAFLELHARHPQPRRTVVFLATGGEETGSDLGVRWLLRERPELFANTWAVLTEGGLLEARGVDDFKYWGTEVAQKRYVEVLACGASRERLEVLRADLLELGDGRIAPRLTPELAEFWEIYAPSRDREDYRELLAEPERLLRDPAAFHALPPYLRQMLQDVVIVGPIRPSEGEGWELPMALLLLPGVELEEALPALLPPWLTAGVTVAVREKPTARHGSPLDHPAFQGVQEELAASHPAGLRGPFLLPTTRTDSRFLRYHGIPSYGFTPFPILPPDTLTLHGVDERIALEGFVEGVALYGRLVERLAGE